METYSSKISENGGDELMSSRQVFHASHLAVPESEMERKMTAISGRRCFVLSTKLDRLGLLVKTLVESSRWYSPARRLKWEVTRTFAERVTRCTRNDNDTLSSKSESTSRQSDIQSSQLLYRLVPSERPTGETGCGFWQEGMMLPTPVAQDYRRRGPNSEQQGLPEMAYNGMLPTPTAIDSGSGRINKSISPNAKERPTIALAAKMGLLPTPQNRDFKNGSTMESERWQRKREQGRTMDLNDLAASKLLPTPNASEATKYTNTYNPNSQMGQSLTALAVNGMLPTPTSRDYQPSVSPTALKRKNGAMRTDALCNIPVIIGKHAKQTGGKTSQLNPLFVTEMMGFPLDYLVSPFQDGDKNR